MRQRIGSLAVLCLVLGADPAAALDLAASGGAVPEAHVLRARAALAAGEQPWTRAWSELRERAELALGETPSAPVDLNVPGYYEDAAGHDAAKRLLRDDVNAAYRCALVYRIGHGLDAATRARHAAKARELLDAWARTNRSVSGADGRLVMAYVGSAFAIAAELLRDDPGWDAAGRARFTQWTDTVLRDVATIASRENNWGSWGVFAGIVGASWRRDTQAFNEHSARLRQLIDQQIDTAGLLPREQGRGSKALWYTYFSLAPLTHAAEIVRAAEGEDLLRWQPPSGGRLEQALDAFLAAAQAAQGPGADPSLTPQPGAWGGDLLYANGHIAGRAAWRDWAKPPFGSANSAWKSADLLVPVPASLPAARPQAPVLLD